MLDILFLYDMIAKIEEDIMSRRTVRDFQVHNIWMCMNVTCDNEEEVDISPDWYENNGTPVCTECDRDMSYRHTEIDD